MNKHDKVMTENFAQGLIDHRNVRLASQGVSELALNHAESGFDVRPFVIVGQKFSPLELEVMVHLRPRATAHSAGIGLERDKWGCSDTSDYFGILARAISLVCGDFRNCEVFSSRIDKSRKQFDIAGIPIMNLNSGNNVGFYPAYQMTFDPIVALLDDSIFMIEPAGETACSEAGRINGEICLNGAERQAAVGYKVVENRSQTGVLKVIGDAVEVRNFGDVAPRLRLSQIAHKTTLRDRGINFEHNIENSVRQRQAGSP